MWSANLTAKKAAELLERYMSDSSEYPQELNDFIDTRQGNPQVERVRKRCKELETFVNGEGNVSPSAVEELRFAIDELKKLPD
jgi:hypothetical protein